MKKFYGVKFLGWNQTRTIGAPHRITGRMSVDCEVQVFRSEADRDDWINNEKLSAPSGCEGGERICRKFRLGDSQEEFEEMFYRFIQLLQKSTGS